MIKWYDISCATLYDRGITDAASKASKETDLEVNVEELSGLVWRSASKNDVIKTGDKYAKSVEQFRYLGTTLTNQNSIHEEIILKAE